MKFLLAVLLFASLAFGDDEVEDKIRQDWDNYKRLNELEFPDNEEIMRFNLYKENYLRVLDHNVDYEQNKTQYRAGLNDFSHYNMEETTLLKFGLRSTSLNESDLVAGYNESDLNDFMEAMNQAKMGRKVLPATVDWRRNSAAIKNQGNCGACWAFAAVGVIESLYSIKYSSFKRFSEQQLVDCTLNNRRYMNYGCRGGWPNNAFEFIRQNGIAEESYYPYRRYAGGCNLRSDLRKVRISRYFPLPVGNEEALKYAVATNGPVAVAIDASQWGFLHYSSGIYQDNRCSTRLTHAVIVMGYGTERGQDYWLVKNSWGANWGQNGYIKMARNRRNMCGITSMASYAQLA